MREALATFLDQVLGPVEEVALHTSPHLSSTVLEVVDDAGDHWFGKHVPMLWQWQQEVRAYRNWVPAFADQAGRVRAANRERRIVVVSAVPGRTPEWLAPDVHHKAGILLRRIHESRPPRASAKPLAERVSRRLESALGLAAPGLLSSEEIRFARRQAAAVEDHPDLMLVPCHGDFRAHNWLVDDAGVLRVIDFAESRWHVAAYDFTLLHFGPWWEKPHLSEAFYDGYGRTPCDAEKEFLRLHLATTAISAIRFSRQHRNPEIEAQARYRLGKLMRGHAFTERPPFVRRTVRRIRRAVKTG